MVLFDWGQLGTKLDIWGLKVLEVTVLLKSSGVGEMLISGSFHFEDRRDRILEAAFCQLPDSPLTRF
jgi:hypothetical protein